MSGMIRRQLIASYHKYHNYYDYVSLSSCTKLRHKQNNTIIPLSTVDDQQASVGCIFAA
jgi:hypothetical protein